MYIMQTVFLGIIFCLPLLWAVKLKCDLEVANHRIDMWREMAIKLNNKLREN